MLKSCQNYTHSCCNKFIGTMKKILILKMIFFQTMPMLMLTGFPIHFLTVIWRGDLRQIITTTTITDQEIIVKAKRGKILKNLLLHYLDMLFLEVLSYITVLLSDIELNASGSHSIKVPMLGK